MRWSFLLVAALLFPGCAHLETRQASWDGPVSTGGQVSTNNTFRLLYPSSEEATVRFPPVQLRQGEYIQAVKVRINGAWIAALQHIPQDWEIGMLTQGGNCVVVQGRAGHFSSGLTNTGPLDQFITVQAFSDAQVQAVITTERTDPPGGEARKIPFRHLALSPVSTDGPTLAVNNGGQISGNHP